MAVPRTSNLRRLRVLLAQMEQKVTRDLRVLRVNKAPKVTPVKLVLRVLLAQMGQKETRVTQAHPARMAYLPPIAGTALR